jgi:hypothetical protein
MEVDQPMHPLKKRKLMRDSLDKREQVIFYAKNTAIILLGKERYFLNFLSRSKKKKKFQL